MTAQLVISLGQQDDAFLKDATEQLHDRFDIAHVTLQVVRAPFKPAGDAHHHPQ
jgi:cobalt-zinc-cadmium efflux system protein